MSWSPEPAPNRDLSADLDGVSGRRTGRARPVDATPPIGARGQWPLGHGRPPRMRERSRRIPKSEADGVIAEEERRRYACSSADAGTLHPAITSHQVSPKRGFAPFESPGTLHGPGAFAVFDLPQPSPTTRHNRRTNSRNVRRARNAELTGWECQLSHRHLPASFQVGHSRSTRSYTRGGTSGIHTDHSSMEA